MRGASPPRPAVKRCAQSECLFGTTKRFGRAFGHIDKRAHRSPAFVHLAAANTLFWSPVDSG